MAALVDGQSYGLSSQGQNSENRTLIFVKLTDSALRAIEEYLICRGTTNRQPTIQFQGNQGTIKFPSSHNASEHAFDFTFSPSSESEGLQGSFECIKKNGSRSLESLGSTQYKMHIQAKDDVYQKTKFRMAAAEEESKKNCTKVIKASGPYMGRKVNVKKTFTAIPPKPAASSPPYASYSKSYSNGVVNKPNVSNGHHHINSNTSSTSSFNNNNKIATVKSHKNLGNPDIMKRTLRERIIHVLALRSYKKPELMLRLTKDGLKEKDKKSLTSNLTSVAAMRNNKYDLAKHAWNEVQEDWPFYTDADKQLLKERMSQNGTSPISNELSPSNVSPPLPKKRPNVDQSSIPMKKQRISHFTKQPEVTPKVNESNKHEGTNDFSQDSINMKTENPEFKRTVSTGFLPQNGYTPNNGYVKAADKINGYGKTAETNGYSNGYSKSAEVVNNNTYGKYASGHRPKSNYSNGYNGQFSNSSALCNGSTGGSHQSTPSSSPDNQDNGDLRGLSTQNDGSSEDEVPDFVKKYTVITNGEQRARYKADFNAEYAEYRKVHAEINKVSQKFAVLEERLRNYEDGSEEWKRVKDQIVKEYKAAKRNEEYQEMKNKFNLLHQKLTHIKKLVLGYNDNCDS